MVEVQPFKGFDGFIIGITTTMGLFSLGSLHLKRVSARAARVGQS